MTVWVAADECTRDDGAMMVETMREIVAACWGVLGQMSPYLLLGFGVAGVLSVFVSPAWVERHQIGRASCRERV